MTNSYAAQTNQLTCPQCSQSFAAEIWLIVDTAERPDLLERIQDGQQDEQVCQGARQTFE